MLSCDEAVRYILRSVDLDGEPAAELGAHIAVCAACRTALDEQRLVCRILRARPSDAVSPAFAGRLDQRLDDLTGWLGIADFRAWTIRLLPAAAALALAAFLGSDSAAAAPSLADWTTSGPEATSEAALLWRPDTTPEAVIETMLGESAGTAGERSDVR